MLSLALLIADRTSCIQRICSFCQYNEPAKRSERSHIGQKLHFFNRSLRHIAARSANIRSGAPEAASPFPGSYHVYLLFVPPGSLLFFFLND